jgi:hypothetical protein
LVRQQQHSSNVCVLFVHLTLSLIIVYGIALGWCFDGFLFLGCSGNWTHTRTESTTLGKGATETKFFPMAYQTLSTSHPRILVP